MLPEIVVRSAAAASLAAAPAPRALAAARVEAAQLRDAAGRLEVLAVPRPCPSQWASLRAEVDRMAKGIGCVPCARVGAGGLFWCIRLFASPVFGELLLCARTKQLFPSDATSRV